MFWRTVSTLSLVGALTLVPAEEVRADAGDFIGGAIVGGLIGHAITRDQQRKQQQQQVIRRSTTTRSTTTRTRTYRPRIPVTEHGRQTQTALNYFGFNAGQVDGQIGSGTRGAIERFQASMNYPINGRNFPPYQFDYLQQAYWWGLNGGAASTGLSGQSLLMAYRQQVNTGYAATVVRPAQPGGNNVTTVIVPAPTTPVAPAPEVVEAASEDASPALPNLFAGSSPTVSLANSCNAVMLQTSTNGGYTTLANLSDADFTMKEQFCLARSYAIARGEETMQAIAGLTPEQISEQCSAFGGMLSAQVDAISLRPQAEAEAEMRTFALGTGIPPADLAATSRVCLAVGYSQDNMEVALGAALMLVTLGEPAYGELLGHHLRQGVGTATRNDLAMQWYAASLNALDTGSPAVFMPSQSERPQLLRAAMTSLSSDGQQGAITATPQVQPAALPTFEVAQ